MASQEREPEVFVVFWGVEEVRYAVGPVGVRVSCVMFISIRRFLFGGLLGSGPFCFGSF